MSAILTGQRRGDPAGEELAGRRGSWQRPGSRTLLPATLAAAVVALDQATKAAVAAWLGPDRAEHRYELLGDLLALEYVENTGGVFGSLRGQGSLLVAVALVVVVGLVVYYRGVARPTPALGAGLGLLVGGALGNVVDRLRVGHVTDFVAVGAWPKFNVADGAITLGVALLAWHVLFASGAGEAADAGQGARE